MKPVSYTFYREVYIGSAVPEEEFCAFAQRAAQRLFYDTNGISAKSLLDGDACSESVRLAVCAVADILYAAKNVVNSGVLKETAGNWSKTYRADPQSAVKAEIESAEALYLSHTGMLYKGRCHGV